jgi:hypothetical protein
MNRVNLSEKKVEKFLDFLCEKAVLTKKGDKYVASQLFDFAFRGHCAVLIWHDNDPTHWESNVNLAVRQTLEHFKLSQKEIQLAIPIVRTFQSDEVYNKIQKLLAR